MVAASISLKGSWHVIELASRSGIFTDLCHSVRNIATPMIDVGIGPMPEIAFVAVFLIVCGVALIGLALHALIDAYSRSSL
jgi:hypothetical protein